MATKKATVKKAPAKKTVRKYSPAASQDIEREMKAMKAGKLRAAAARR